MPDFSKFTTTKRASRPTETAPDGAALRPLLGVAGGTMAHFELAAGETSRAVAHRTVDEIWYVVSGSSLPRGTRFQFRASEAQAIAIVAVTIPRWPGNFEAELVDGPWSPSARP